MRGLVLSKSFLSPKFSAFLSSNSSLLLEKQWLLMFILSRGFGSIGTMDIYKEQL
jgi:hypothetical protein